MTEDDDQTGFDDAQYLARESQTEDASSMPVCESCSVICIMCWEGGGGGGGRFVSPSKELFIIMRQM